MSINLKNLKNKNIHIVGIGGAEGSAVAEFLAENNISSITGHDFSLRKDFRKAFYSTHLSLKPDEREKALEHLLDLPIKINFKDHYLEGVENADIVFVSQVWFKYPQNLPILQNLKNSGVSFKTITNLYFELAPCKIISVTGTNGKTTTARLINNIFEIWAEKNNNKKIYFAGNDRQNVQVLDKLNKMTKNDVFILETSSTQLLLNSGISPYIGVITNITPNHLDDHGSFENYIEAKKNLIRYQKKDDFAVLNYDDEQSRKFIKFIKSKVFSFSRKKELKEGCFVKDDSITIRENSKDCRIRQKILKQVQNDNNIVCNINDIKIPGKHNLENILAAVSVAYLYGVEPEIIKEGIINYAGTKHRLKLLYNIKGIKYYDDTQATTPEAAIAGIESFNNNVILLAGGDDKGMNYKKLAERINKKVKLLILFPGDASDKIEKLVDKKEVDFMKVNNFAEAMRFLEKYCQKNALSKNSVVLISPASAHFYSKFVEGSGKSLREWVKLAASSK
ncbi:MAG: UDP-N-acetylmuramoyl-L-alanine--D-glutamate ligase [Patescibacteria group bacterium]|nr:UDP-N-acetylmuramoyl-L-alanine--D-glutamate ligase [Patescibacteria group bacterium]